MDFLICDVVVLMEGPAPHERAWRILFGKISMTLQTEQIPDMFLDGSFKFGSLIENMFQKSNCSWIFNSNSVTATYRTNFYKHSLIKMTESFGEAMIWSKLINIQDSVIGAATSFELWCLEQMLVVEAEVLGINQSKIQVN